MAHGRVTDSVGVLCSVVFYYTFTWWHVEMSMKIALQTLVDLDYSFLFPAGRITENNKNCFLRDRPERFWKAKNREGKDRRTVVVPEGTARQGRLNALDSQ
jgi:hypothetical protein